MEKKKLNTKATAVCVLRFEDGVHQLAIMDIDTGEPLVNIGIAEDNAPMIADRLNVIIHHVKPEKWLSENQGAAEAAESLAGLQ